MNTPRTAEALRTCGAAMVEIADALEEEAAFGSPNTPLGVEADSQPTSWRSRLWTEHEERRIGVEETAEALYRSASWVYKNVGPKVEDPLPCTKFRGELSFQVGELRSWLLDEEERVHRPPRTLRQVS